jgi:hypothetical protein
LAEDFAAPVRLGLTEPFVDLESARTTFFEDVFTGGVAFLARTFTLPTTTSDPMDGMIVDTSPPDQVICNKAPLTPVTIPSRGA